MKLSGMPVYVESHLCRPHFVRFRKNHRKARINRKWHKKYGAITRCDGHAYQVLNRLIVCPCSMRKMRELADFWEGER